MPAPPVLVVGDGPVVLRRLKADVESTGFGVISARDGAEGIEATRAEAPP